MADIFYCILYIFTLQVKWPPLSCSKCNESLSVLRAWGSTGTGLGDFTVLICITFAFSINEKQRKKQK